MAARRTAGATQLGAALAIDGVGHEDVIDQRRRVEGVSRRQHGEIVQMGAIDLLFTARGERIQRDAAESLHELLRRAGTGGPGRASHRGLDAGGDCAIVVNDHAHAVIIVFHLCLYATRRRRYTKTPPETRQLPGGVNRGSRAHALSPAPAAGPWRGDRRPRR